MNKKYIIALIMLPLFHACALHARINLALRIQRMNVIATQNPNNALVEDINITTDVPTRVYVQYGNNQAGFLQTQTTQFLSKTSRVQLFRLRAETSYFYKVFAIDQNDNTFSSPLMQFTSGTLPTDLQGISFEKTGTITPNLIIMSIICTQRTNIWNQPVLPTDPQGPTTVTQSDPPFLIGACMDTVESTDANGNISLNNPSSSLIGIDSSGQIVWYFDGQGNNVGACYKLKTQPGYDTGGFLVERGSFFGPTMSYVQAIQADGREIYRNPTVNTVDPSRIGTVGANIGSVAVHHDLLPVSYPDNNVYYLGNKIMDPFFDNGSAAAGARLQLGVTIRGWLPGQYDVEKWSVFNYVNPITNRGSLSNHTASALDPSLDVDQLPLYPEDWIHSNAIRLNEVVHNQYTVSLRLLNQVIALNKSNTNTFGNIEWVVGPAANTIPASFYILPTYLLVADPNATFYGQHDPHVIAQGSNGLTGTLLMFDNDDGNPLNTQTSRGLEVSLDFTNNAAHLVWEYNPLKDPAIGTILYSPVLGSAQRLSNGNTLVLFGDTASGPKYIIEAGIASNTSVGYFSLPQSSLSDYAVYRATYFTSIAGETAINGIN